ncbi:hypothetical protein BGX31_006543 [Mortierella sp. GBA43]|nr:hypothetical protein BGX31_006543 [Mortierella sp. GBA43]
MGGVPETTLNSTSQSFMIDLSVSWNTSAPVIQSLPKGPKGSFMPSTWAPLSAGQDRGWLVLAQDTMYKYNVKAKSWSPVMTLDGFFRTKNNNSTWTTQSKVGLWSVTDPETGMMYLSSTTYEPDSNRTSTNSLWKIDAGSNAVVNSSPVEILQDETNTNGGGGDRNLTTIADKGAMDEWASFSAVWSPLRKQILVFGGQSTSTQQLLTYTPATGSWARLNLTGNIPTPRYGGCFVSAYGGSRVIYFGGLGGARIEKDSDTGSFATPSATAAKSANNDLYILDVGTMTWERGPSIRAPSARAYSACAVSGDHFISWGSGVGEGDSMSPLGVTNNGGKTSPLPMQDTAVLVYNLKSKEWVTEYKAQPQLSPCRATVPTGTLANIGPTGTSQAPQSTLSPEGSSPTSAELASRYSDIIGAALKVFVVVLSVGGTVLYGFRLKRKRDRKIQDDEEKLKKHLQP